jgi:uncharacterized protein YcbK (DUF882 family)
MSYFSLEEMRCKSGSVYPAEFVQVGKWARLQASLDRIRDAWGGPLTIISGYREPSYNAQLREASIARLVAGGRTPEQAERETGVAKDSQHMHGTAADIRPSEDARSPQLHAMIMAMVKSGKLPLIGGVGGYPTWCHVDVRPRNADNSIATWG